MKFNFVPKSLPTKIVMLALVYSMSCCGILSYMMYEYIQAGCSWKRIAFYTVGIVLCIFAGWLFVCGEKLACAFMLGASVYGTIYCMSLLLSGQSFIFSLVELAFLAIGALTFFSGRYFVGNGIAGASTVQSMIIVLGSGICMIPVYSCLITGSGMLEAFISLLCAVLLCMHTKAGKFCVMVYMLMAIFVYGMSFYLMKNIFYLFIAVCYALLLVITYMQRNYLVLNLNLKLHK